MNHNHTYSGSLTREQFLFYEMRIVARMLCGGLSQAEILERICRENLFQFPTERMNANITSVCVKRAAALSSNSMLQELAEGPVAAAKQINLYAMMCQNKIVWDFMISVVGEKYRTQNLELSPTDLNMFMRHLQEQDDNVASWSESTISKIKQVLKKCLVECDFLDSAKSTVLNPVYPYDELIDGIKANGDFDALAAFNYFE